MNECQQEKVSGWSINFIQNCILSNQENVITVEIEWKYRAIIGVMIEIQNHFCSGPAVIPSLVQHTVAFVMNSSSHARPLRGNEYSLIKVLSRSTLKLRTYKRSNNNFTLFFPLARQLNTLLARRDWSKMMISREWMKMNFEPSLFSIVELFSHSHSTNTR